MTPAPQRCEGPELLLTSKLIFLDKLGVTEACHFDCTFHHQPIPFLPGMLLRCVSREGLKCLCQYAFFTVSSYNQVLLKDPRWRPK